jgi:glycosyltransferase involved in cell wall biosynthesis
MTQTRPRVAVDAHTLGRRATGNETYVRGLLGGLVGRADIDPVILVDPKASVEDQFAPWVKHLSAQNAVIRLLRELGSPGRNWSADLLHVQYVRPPRCDVACITTIHDISYEHFRDLFDRRTLLRMRITIPWSARHSAAVITGSQYTRNDLIEHYRLKPHSVHVTPYAVDSRFRPLPLDVVRDTVERLGLPNEYLLYVGNLQPRKNLPRLLRAYVGLHADGIRVPLVIVGQRAWLSDEIFETVRRHGLKDSVYFTGYVPIDDLPALYTSALAFVYPSLFEGFGLPVLEALACGVPTVTSSVSSLPEVAGDAALLVDPRDTAALSAALARVLSDTDLRVRLTAAGPLRASTFSWERCAAQTAAIYQSVLA